MIQRVSWKNIMFNNQHFTKEKYTQFLQLEYMHNGTVKQKCFTLETVGRVIQTNGVLYMQHFVEKIMIKFNSQVPYLQCYAIKFQQVVLSA